MKKCLILLIFCAAALFGVQVNTGNFTVKSTPSKEGKYDKLSIYQNGTLKQEIQGTYVTCDHEPLLFGDTDASNEYPSFTYLCGLGHEFELFFYDESGEFFHERAFEGNADEILEIKNHIIILSYPYSDEKAFIRVFDKSSKNFVQLFEDIDSSCNYIDTKVGRRNEFDMKCLEKGDYNFDDLEDFSLFDGFYAAGNTESLYFLYDTKTKKFFLSDIGGTNLEFDHENKIITETNRCCAGSLMEITKHKLTDNKMSKIETRCYRYDAWEDEEYAEYDCDKQPLRQFYLTSIGLKNNFEIRITISDENFSGGTVKYKGQEESMELKLKEKTDNKVVFNEFYDGAFSGTYTLNLTDFNITSAFYIRKDGKRFKLKMIEDSLDE
jgi:hypothetical protein